MWQDEKALRRFVNWPVHVAIMRKYRDAGKLTSTNWTAERFIAVRSGKRQHDTWPPMSSRHENAISTESRDITNPPYIRLSAASEALFILAFSAALFDLGAPPKVSDTDAKVASILIHTHSRILHGMYLAGLAIMLGIWFFATVQRWLAQATDGARCSLRRRPSPRAYSRLPSAPSGCCCSTAPPTVAGQGGLSAVRALTDAGNASIELLKFPLATFILAVSLTAHRAGLLPRRFIQVGAAGAVVLVASAIPLFAHGSFTQFGGGLDVIGAAPGTIWIFALSLAMVKWVTVPTTSPALEDPSR